MPNQPNGSEGTGGVLTRAGKVLRWLGAIGGTVAGVGTLAFAGGFLASRAQYAFAQVPFVFIDYWAYAETGIMAFVRSVYLVLARPWVPGILLLASLGILLALEVGSFRRQLGKAHFLFGAFVILLAVQGWLVFQAFEVRRLLTDPSATTRDKDVESDPLHAHFPWTLLVGRPVVQPEDFQAAPPEDSFEGWEALAADLDAEIGRGAHYLDVRPRPRWAAAPRLGPNPIVGPVVSDSDLESRRAERLYQAILISFLLTVWCFVVLTLWQRLVLRDLQRAAEPPRSSSRWSRMTWRLKEEIWFGARWVLRPASVALLAITGAFLLPECYGILAMPQLGQEYVEVVFQNDTGVSQGTDSSAQVTRLDTERETKQLWRMLNRFDLRDPEQVRALQKEWGLQIERLERLETVPATELLHIMTTSAAAVAPPLADAARDAWTRASARTVSRREGYILYYPRSDTDSLRLLQRSPLSHRKRWTIFPIPMSSIVEIHVRRDEGTLRLVEVLRSMRNLRDEQRMNALIEAEMLGHPRLLEVALASTRDRSHKVRGAAITDVGRYAAALPDEPENRLRLRMATTRLFEILTDPGERNDLRSAAATALSRFVPLGDSTVCSRLRELLIDSPGELHDPRWEIRGFVLTTIGRLACRDAATDVLALLENNPGEAPDHSNSMPERLKATIITQLIHIATQEQAAPVLRRLVLSDESSSISTGSALMALALIPGKDHGTAVDTLVKYLGRPIDSSDEMLAEHRVTAAESLRRIGDRRAVPALHRHVLQDVESDVEVRKRSAQALGEMEHPDSEAVLLTVLRDRAESSAMRVQAARSLRTFSGHEATRELARIFEAEADQALRSEIVQTLEVRGVAGSGYAASLAQRHRSALVSLEAATTGIQRRLGPGQEGQRLNLASEEAALFELRIAEAGVYLFEATVVNDASGDPFLFLFRADNRQLVASDDDGGGDLDAALRMSLGAGTYLLGVRNIARDEGEFEVRMYSDQ